MKRTLNNKGFTLVELLSGLFVWLILIFIIGSVIVSNCWVNKSTALEAIKYEDASIIEVAKLERRFWRYSKAIARDRSGTEKKFYIDTDILQNRTAIPVTDESNQ